MTRPPPVPALDGRRLVDAVNHQREQEGLSWAALSRAVGVAASTIKRIGATSSGEADGVVALVRWLGLPLEHFVTPMTAGVRMAGDDFARSGQMLRVDVKDLHARLDAERERRALRWADVAEELSVARPVSPAMLTRLRTGGRIEVNLLLACAHWLGVATSDVLEPTAW